MSEVTDLLEHMEHVGHSGGHGHGDGAKGPGKEIGITMALLGVMLAFCAAMVGSERTELIKTMVEQSNKYGIYQSETTKLRVIDGNLEILKALTPSKEEAAKLDATLRNKSRNSGKADDEDTAELKDLIASSMDDMADLLAPDQSDVKHFEILTRRYQNDVKEAKEDAEAYEGAVRTHERASELYERAQLAAEIGIVVASVALLMASRKVWAISLISGALGLATVGYTAWTTHVGLAESEAKIEEAAKREAVMDKEDEDGDGKPDEPKAGAAKPADAKPEAAKANDVKPEAATVNDVKPAGAKKDAPPKK